MGTPTRELATIRCKGCGGVVLVESRVDRDVRCPSCGAEVRIPKRVVDDLDLGRVLKIDAESELRAAVDAVVEERFEPPLPARSVLIVLAMVSAGLGAWAWHATALRPSTSDYVIGGVVGLLLGVLPPGYTAQWLATMALGRAASRASTHLRAAPLACPACALSLPHPAGPGAIDCPGCKESLVMHPEAVVLREGERSNRWRAAVERRLEDAPWLTNTKPTAGEWAMVLGVWLVVMCCAGVWLAGPSLLAR